MRPWILGISASHNAAFCLLHGDEIRVAVQEERLRGVKRARVKGSGKSLGLRYCLEAAGLAAGDLDAVVLSSQGPADSPEQDLWLNQELRSLAREAPRWTVSHHMAHAISATATSGFEETAALVVDGLGSPAADLPAAARNVAVGPLANGWEIASLYTATRDGVTPIEVQLVPDGRWVVKHRGRMWDFHSLGGLYSAVAHQIFGDPMEAGKVMGLAAYGCPRFEASEFLVVDGQRVRFTNGVQRHFDTAERWPSHQPLYRDLAASAQKALEYALTSMASWLRRATGQRNLCLAGGVALNSVANERIVRECGFSDVYIVPAADDSGPAIGAAYYGLWRLGGCSPRRRRLSDEAGKPYSLAEVDEAIASIDGVKAAAVGDLLDDVVDRLCAGEICGWFQGGSELGPRALGQRSILCDPRRPDAKQELNARVKFREPFRPFAPAVLAEKAADWFDVDGCVDSPFMLRVIPFRPDKQVLVPAVVHEDGTGRLQTLTPESSSRLRALAERFHRRTGVPILLNTSFNVMGEPIVETPYDALWCLLGTGLDFCVLGDRLVTKADRRISVLDRTPRIVARQCALTIPVQDGRLGAMTGDGGILVTANTPWGESEVPVSKGLFLVLGAIDGERTGHDLCRELSDHYGPDEMIRALLILRRMNVIALNRTPDVPRH